METFIEMIDTIGIERLAKTLKVPVPHIRVMKNRDSIPQDYWPDLVKLGFSLDHLVRLRKGMFKRRRSLVRRSKRS